MCEYNHRLHRKLKENRMRQEDMAQKIGISRSVISGIITGRLVPKEKEVIQISAILGVPPEEIFKKELLR